MYFMDSKKKNERLLLSDLLLRHLISGDFTVKSLNSGGKAEGKPTRKG